MATTEATEHFFSTKFLTFCQNTAENKTGLWGKMNFQQMLEHFTDSILLAINDNNQVISPPEVIPGLQRFIEKDTPFKENTVNPSLPDYPNKERCENIAAALNELQVGIALFYRYFSESPERKTNHPIFGELEYSKWVKLLNKHAMHHARQFGYSENAQQ